MLACPYCGEDRSELITHPKLDEAVCYWCARELLDLDFIQPIEREDG